jgi:hypothetical protein
LKVKHVGLSGYGDLTFRSKIPNCNITINKHEELKNKDYAKLRKAEEAREIL